MKKDITLKLKVTPKMLKDMELNQRANGHDIAIPKVKEIIRDIRKHFKVDGWDLAYDHYKSDLVEAVAPGLADYLMFSILKSGHTILVRDRDGQIVIRPSKKPAPKKSPKAKKRTRRS